MSDLSIRTLMLSIGALARERASLMQTLKTATLEQDSDGHLSEHVMDIDQALDELADEYEALRGDSQTYPTFERLTGMS